MKHFFLLLVFCLNSYSQEFPHPISPMFNMEEIYDASSLDIEVIEDWHHVDGPTPSRQKYIKIHVGEFWPGQDYRVPLRLVVPANKKAKGFHLTGGNKLQTISKDLKPRGVDEELLKEGVGLAFTIVQEFGSWGQRDLGNESKQRFAKTLNPKHSIQYWAWPASLMRCVTAAFAESNHFDHGKVLLSGGSKNGASPSVAIIHDPRITAVHATVSPICESPLRLCDDKAWDELKKHYAKNGIKSEHRFLGGTYGPIYNQSAIDAGNTWAQVQNTAKSLAPYIFISKNWEQLMKRGCELYFHPGTHDFVCFDMVSLGKNYPQIPTYNRINSGHGKKNNGAKVEKRDASKQAFILQHFLSPGRQMLTPPQVTYKTQEGKALITVRFKPQEKVESGRIYWMYDRALEGSVSYIQQNFPAENSKEMTQNKNIFTVTIPLDSNAKHIDFYSNHRKDIKIQKQLLPSHISSPYIRVKLK